MLCRYRAACLISTSNEYARVSILLNKAMAGSKVRAVSIYLSLSPARRRGKDGPAE
jgi:hypothetical protein